MKFRIVSPLILSLLVLSGTFCFSQPAVDLGLKAMKVEKFNLAKEIFSSQIVINPGDAMLYFYRGNAFFEIGKMDSARMDYQKGTTLTGNPAGAACNQAGLGKLMLVSKNAAGAKEAFTKALNATGSKDVKVLMVVADCWISTDTKDAPEALNLLNKALAIDKKNAQIYLLMGDAYATQIDGGGKAVTSYEKALEINPQLAEAHFRIGELYMQARNNEEAFSAFQKCIKVDSMYVPVYREMGEVYHKLRKSAEAKESYKKYMEMAEPNILTMTRYAQFLFLTKDYKGTGNLIDQIMKADSSNPVLFRLLGYSNYETGKFPEAMDAMTRFFAKADSQKILTSDYEYFGKALSKTGNDSTAVLYLNKVIKADTSRGDIHGEIAGIYTKQKKYDLAGMEYGLKIRSSGPSTPDYFLMGQAYYNASMYAAADSAFIKVTELKPKSHIGYLWRARTNFYLDSTHTTGVTKQNYEKVAEIISSDSTLIPKYKKDIVESYSYLGNSYLQKDDNKNAKEYYLKVLELDPANEDAKKVINGLKKTK